MRLPEELRNAVRTEVEAANVSAVTRASQELSESYRKRRFSTPPLSTAAHRAAYLNVRLPATFAACRRVLQELQRSLPGFAPKSLLDLGAGPGTAAWAATEAFPSIEKVMLLERDREMVAIGRRLAATSAGTALRNAVWKEATIANIGECGSFDLVIASYVLCELQPALAEQVLHTAWQSTSQALVIVEPGTRAAFQGLAAFRNTLIESGASIAAPCPHQQQCPMLAAGDWCHFAVRLERHAEHRQQKGATLGYEDEKFSYICATRLVPHRADARIVRHPLKYPGHLKLELCSAGKICRETVTKSQKEAYRRARKAEWGDSWIDAHKASD